MKRTHLDSSTRNSGKCRDFLNNSEEWGCLKSRGNLTTAARLGSSFRKPKGNSVGISPKEAIMKCLTTEALSPSSSAADFRAMANTPSKEPI